MKSKRPFLVYALTILFLLAGVFSLLGITGLFKAWNWLLSFTPLKSLIFQVFLGILITLAWVSAAIILWLRLHWAILYSSCVTILTTVWFWVERIFLTKNPLPFNRHALLMVITCVFLLFVFSSLYLVVPSMRSFQTTQNDGGSTSIQPTGEKNE